ncbi:UDP-glucose-4-epimerase [Gonapodya sp. JEL0774]|nr:UDP-glucose-4-epimerase [Gonapodya sp. JEL0774]
MSFMLPQVERATKALLAWFEKSRPKSQDNELPLAPEAQFVWVVVATRTIPDTYRAKPIKVPLPHSFLPSSASVCLITKDPQREYKDKLDASPDGEARKLVNKVIGVSKLKAKYKPFEAKRQLVKEYDLFLADERVLPLLPKILGKKFFEAKNSIRVGITSQSAEQLTANILSVLNTIVSSHIPRKWANVQSVHVKTSESVSLPVYNALPEEKMVIEVKPKSAENAARAGSKRKRNEEETGAEGTTRLTGDKKARKEGGAEVMVKEETIRKDGSTKTLGQLVKEEIVEDSSLALVKSQAQKKSKAGDVTKKVAAAAIGQKPAGKASSVFVVGGAGYIGSHAVRELIRTGKHEVVAVDNLSKGHAEAVSKGATLEKGDIRDAAFLEDLFRRHKPDAVMHMSAYIVVPDSVRDPLDYYDNNVCGTVNLLRAMVKHNCRFIIFSSTAALFAAPKTIPIPSDEERIPMSPYGDTKLVVENILTWCESAYGIKSVCLRYFNACGADADGDIGEDHEPETHLIPMVLQVPLGRRKEVKIYGTDYPTSDGTAVRDYVHVTDLATAHIKALEYMVTKNKSGRFNLGSGKGYSVREVLEAARKVTGHPIPAIEEGRREGDPPVLIASSKDAEEHLGWVRKYNSVEDIIASAWKFHQTHPRGIRA